MCTKHACESKPPHAFKGNVLEKAERQHEVVSILRRKDSVSKMVCQRWRVKDGVPLNGTIPVTSMNASTPTLQRSLASVYARSSTSGA